MHQPTDKTMHWLMAFLIGIAALLLVLIFFVLRTDAGIGQPLEPVVIEKIVEVEKEDPYVQMLDEYCTSTSTPDGVTTTLTCVMPQVKPATSTAFSEENDDEDEEIEEANQDENYFRYPTTTPLGS